MPSAFVTGAGQGLGKGFVEQLLTEGYQVFAGVRTKKPEHQDTNKLNYIVCDVSDDNSILEASKSVSRLTPSLDLLINTAGINKDTGTGGHPELVTKLGSLDRAALLHLFNVNSIGPLLMTKTFLPFLTGNPSYVINISSDRASYHDEFENPSANYGYRASKAALNMYTFCSIRDLPENIRTFAVHPGDIQSEMNPDGSQLPVNQAKAILAITQNWNPDFNGKFLRWDGTLYPF